MRKYIQNIVFLLGVACILQACEKEIQLDYRPIDPLYVIEAKVDNSDYKVSLNLTRDMEAAQATIVDDGKVFITSPYGVRHELKYSAADSLYSFKAAETQLGEYALEVIVGEKVFRASSTMNAAPEVGELDVKRESLSILGDYLSFKYPFRDFAGETNFYLGRSFVNGKINSFADIRDDYQDGAWLDFHVLLEEFGVNESQDLEDTLLYDGDLIELELSSIDEAVCLYWSSLEVGESSSSNPISNISGGALGYFSAQSTVRLEYVYRSAAFE